MMTQRVSFTNERYIYIASIIKSCYKKKNKGRLTTSDKIDKVVTNRWLGLPIFAVIMFLVYYISMQTVGTAATDWANDGLSVTVGTFSVSAHHRLPRLKKPTVIQMQLSRHSMLSTEMTTLPKLLTLNLKIIPKMPLRLLLQNS